MFTLTQTMLTRVTRFMGLMSVLLGLAALLLTATTAEAKGAVGVLSITAVDAQSGKAIPKAAVAVLANAGGYAVKGGTDAQGVYTVNLPAGQYTVVLSPIGYESLKLAATVKLGATTTLRAPLVSNTAPVPAPTPALTSPIVPGTLIVQVSAIKANDLPLYATVSVQTLKGAEVQQGKTNADDQFIAAELLPQEYVVVVSAPGYENYKAQATVKSNQKTELIVPLQALASAAVTPISQP